MRGFGLCCNCGPVGWRWQCKAQRPLQWPSLHDALFPWLRRCTVSDECDRSAVIIRSPLSGRASFPHHPGTPGTVHGLAGPTRHGLLGTSAALPHAHLCRVARHPIQRKAGAGYSILFPSAHRDESGDPFLRAKRRTSVWRDDIKEQGDLTLPPICSFLKRQPLASVSTRAFQHSRGGAAYFTFWAMLSRLPRSWIDEGQFSGSPAMKLNFFTQTRLVAHAPRADDGRLGGGDGQMLVRSSRDSQQLLGLKVSRRDVGCTTCGKRQKPGRGLLRNHCSQGKQHGSDLETAQDTDTRALFTRPIAEPGTSSTHGFRMSCDPDQRAMPSV
nr:hypothetical protein CFP56_11868 [Quercus suber]